MKARVMKITENYSKYGGKFFYIFFKSETGESYRSCLFPLCHNFKHWKPIIDRKDEGLWLDHLLVKDGRLIDADSVPVIIKDPIGNVEEKAAEEPAKVYTKVSNFDRGREKLREARKAMVSIN